MGHGRVPWRLLLFPCGALAGLLLLHPAWRSPLLAGLEAPAAALPLSEAEAAALRCASRPTAAQLLRAGNLTVAFPLIGSKDAKLFDVEPDYKRAWRRHGVREIRSLDAAFVVSKQRPQDLGILCKQFPRHQVFNHLPPLDCLTVKSRLVETLRNFSRAHPERLQEVQRLVPPTYYLADAQDCEAFGQQVAGASWVQKHPRKHNSLGVRLLDAAGAQKLAAGCRAARARRGRGMEKVLVQQYLTNPFLVEGRKCDFRVYLYIPVTVPLLAFYAPDWYMRCSDLQHDPASLDLRNVVTNTKVAGKFREGANYSELVWGRERLQQYLSSKGFPADWVRRRMAEQLKQKLGLLVEAVGPMPPVGYELLGCDLLLDSDLNLWLIEVNSSPALDASLGARQQAVMALLPAVVGVQLDLLRFAATGRPRRELSAEDLPSAGPLELVYSSSFV